MAFHGAFSLLLQCMENLAGEVEQLSLQGGKLALKVFKAVTIVQEKRSVVVEVHNSAICSSRCNFILT